MYFNVEFMTFGEQQPLTWALQATPSTRVRRSWRCGMLMISAACRHLPSVSRPLACSGRWPSSASGHCTLGPHQGRRRRHLALGRLLRLICGSETRSWWRAATVLLSSGSRPPGTAPLHPLYPHLPASIMPPYPRPGLRQMPGASSHRICHCHLSSPTQGTRQLPILASVCQQLLLLLHLISSPFILLLLWPISRSDRQHYEQRLLTSSCLSVWNTSAPRDGFLWQSLWRTVSKSVEQKQIWLKLEKYNRCYMKPNVHWY